MQKHSVKIAGHSTSISLEPEFWAELVGLAEEQELSINDLITEIDTMRDQGNLSSAIRIYVLKTLKEKVKNGAE